MATQLVRTNGTALLVGTIDGKEVAVSVEEVLDMLGMWCSTSVSDTQLPDRANKLLQDYLRTVLSEVRAEAF